MCGASLGGPATLRERALMSSNTKKPTRELAQRLSGTVEVLLLWHPAIEQVELSVCDLATGTGFHLDVAPDNALDAFHHPYAYAASREARAERTIVNG
jgi:hypothetical protein